MIKYLINLIQIKTFSRAILDVFRLYPIFEGIVEARFRKFEAGGGDRSDCPSGGGDIDIFFSQFFSCDSSTNVQYAPMFWIYSFESYSVYYL